MMISTLSKNWENWLCLVFLSNNKGAIFIIKRQQLCSDCLMTELTLGYTKHLTTPSFLSVGTSPNLSPWFTVVTTKLCLPLILSQYPWPFFPYTNHSSHRASAGVSRICECFLYNVILCPRLEVMESNLHGLLLLILDQNRFALFN